LRRVVTKCGLQGDESGADGAPAIERAVERLEKNLKVSPARKANIIVVEYVDTDPRRAVTVLSNLAPLYLEDHLKIHGTHGTYAFFKGESDRYQHELAEAEANLAEYRQSENILMLPEQKLVMLQKAAETETALMQTEAAIGEHTQKILDAIRQLNRAAPRVTTQSRTISNQFSIERFQTMLAELQNRRTQIPAKFQPDDGLVQEVEKELQDTRSAMDSAVRLTGVDEATDINPVHQTLQLDLSRQQNELAGLKSKRDSLARQ